MEDCAVRNGELFATSARTRIVIRGFFLLPKLQSVSVSATQNHCENGYRNWSGWFRRCGEA